MRYYPKFVNKPIISEVGIHEITVTTKFDVDGWAFVAAIPYSISVNETQLSTLTH